MSGQIKVEKELFFEIRAVACFLCNYDFSDGAQPWQIFEKRFDEQGKLSDGLCEILSAMLDTDILETAAHSTVLCDKCNASLLEYEQLEHKLREIRNEIKSNYNHTMKYILNQNDLAPAADILKTECSPEAVANAENDVCYKSVALSDTDAGIAHMNIIQEVKVESELQIDAMPAISNSQNLTACMTENLGYDAQQSIGNGQHVTQDDLAKQNDLNAHTECAHQQFGAKNFLDVARNTYSAQRPLKCNVCAKSFSTAHNLKLHMMLHTNEKPSVCHTYGKSYARRVEVKAHEPIATAERPFKCDQCPMAFAQRSNLNAHKKSTHLSEKLYTCQECNKSFKQFHRLNYHMHFVHTSERSHKCDMCGATFDNTEQHKAHMLMHNSDKPYACEICGKQFNSRDNRNAHRFVHSDKKPYECMACGAGFMRKPPLLAHMQQAKHDIHKIIVNRPQFKRAAPRNASGAECNSMPNLDTVNSIEVLSADEHMSHNDASEILVDSV